MRKRSMKKKEKKMQRVVERQKAVKGKKMRKNKK